MSSLGMREKYQSLALTDLKDIAKSRGIKGTSSMKKADVIEAMLALDEKEAQSGETAAQEKKPAAQRSTHSRKAETAQTHKAGSAQGRRAAAAETDRPEAAQSRRTAAAADKTDAQNVKTDSTEAVRAEAAEGRIPEAAENRKTEAAESRKADAVENRRPEAAEGRRTEGSDRRPENREARRTEDRQTENGQEYRNPSRIVRSTGTGNAPAARGTERRSVRRFAPVQGSAGQGYTQGQNYSQGQSYSQGQNNYSQQQSQQSSGAAYTAGTQNSGGTPTQSDASVIQIPAEEGFPAELDSGVSANGILEVMPDGYGFIRCANYLPGENDVYVAPSQIRRFGLKTGDIIVGNTRVKTQNEKFSALLYVKSINGYTPEVAVKRYSFEDMTPIFPEERISLELSRSSVSMRIMDLISPVGKGQRGLIVSPPKAGKTTLLKQVAQSVKTNNPDMHLIILLIDERPEEVTDFREAIEGPNVEVIYSTFDELPEHHKRVSEMVIERAKRLVEHKKDVMILLDSITRLTRAYNLVVPPSGRTLSGGLDPASLHMPKRFFGAARNMREGGSLTILATALVDTGSRMDDVIYEEFKGTGNMEIVLDRKLSERRVFPAIDIPKSSTRREDLLLSPEELEATGILRKALNGMKPEEAVDKILDMFTRTRSNTDFVNVVRKMKIL